MKKETFFPITSVSREDLESVGFDTSKIDDSKMQELAHRLASDYMEQLYWQSLEDIAEIMGFPRKTKDISQETFELLCKVMLGEPVIEEDICLCGDDNLPYDGKEHYYDIKCYDGMAFGEWTHDEEGATAKYPKYVIMKYPKLADILNDDEKCRHILEYRGLRDLTPQDITYGDIMMAYGSVFLKTESV